MSAGVTDVYRLRVLARMCRTLNAFPSGMEGGRSGDAQDQGEAPQRPKPRQRQRQRSVKTTFNSIIVLSCTDRLPCLRSIGELSPRHRRRGMRADRAVSLARDAVSLAVQGPLRTTRSALRCGKFLRLRTFLAPEKRVCGKHHSGRGQLFIFPSGAC